MKTQLSGLSFSLPEFWASFPLNMPMNSPMWEVVGMLDEELRERIDRFRLLGFDTSSEQVKPGIGKAVRETLSAFSHSDGGTLIIGLSETQGFTPVEGFDPQSAQNQLMSRCEQMTPVVRPEIEILKVDDALVLVAEIPEMQSLDKPAMSPTRGATGVLTNAPVTAICG